MTTEFSLASRYHHRNTKETTLTLGIESQTSSTANDPADIQGNMKSPSKSIKSTSIRSLTDATLKTASPLPKICLRKLSESFNRSVPSQILGNWEVSSFLSASICSLWKSFDNILIFLLSCLGLVLSDSF